MSKLSTPSAWGPSPNRSITPQQYPGAAAPSTRPPTISQYPGSKSGSKPGSKHGSRASLDRLSRTSAEAAAVDLNPQLINPADATIPVTADDVRIGEPAGSAEMTPASIEQMTSRERLDADKKAATGGKKSKVSAVFGSGIGKVRGLFKKGGKKTEDNTYDDIYDDDDVMGSQEVLDQAGVAATEAGAEKQSAMQRLQGYFRSKPTIEQQTSAQPQMASPSPYQPGDVMILNDPPPPTVWTFGNFINAMLVAFMVAGLTPRSGPRRGRP